MKTAHLARWFAAVFLLGITSSPAQSVISINIAGGNQNAPGAGGAGGEGIVTGTAGLGQLGNWNNLIGTGGTVSDLLDSTGVATSASVTWVTNNTWSTSTADGAGTDVDLMSGYLDNFQANGSVVVSGLGPEFTGPGYNVLVYYQNDNDLNTAGFTAVDNLANTDTRYGHQVTANNNYPLAGPDGYVVSTETGSDTTVAANIVQLSGFSGQEFTLTGNAGTGQPSTRSRPNAIQIVAQGVAEDSDGDGLPNDWEVTHDLDPNDDGTVDPVNGPAGDPDGDTLANLEELNRGTNPRDEDSDDDLLGDEVEDNTGTYLGPTQTGSDPNNADSDGDTIEDGAEVEANPFVTDPNSADTDGDSLNDADEVAANPFVTDPTKDDTDGDGFGDNAEIALGTDPTDENDFPTAGGTRVISVNFEGQSGTGSPGPVTEVAGAIPAGNWNNSGISTLSGPLDLVDDTGNATGAVLDWTVANQWTTNGGDLEGSDARMMQGYLDNFHNQPPMTIANIPPGFSGGGYKLLIYHNTDSAGTMGFTVDDGIAPPVTYYSHQPGASNSNFPLTGADPFGGAAGYIGSRDTASGTTTPSNYTLFTNLRGATLTIKGVAGTSGDGRSRPNGFQIVANEPPADEDMDGLDDSWETANGLDPADDGSVDVNNGPDGDPDNDGSSNLQEFERGTDPREEDSDGDGLADGVETGTGAFVDANDTGTDPRAEDTDGDGLEDGEELTVHGTDPVDGDTDDDTHSDGAEVQAGTDPSNPGSYPPLPAPIGYWSFNDQGAGGVTEDLSGGGHEGTLNGGPEVVEGHSGEGDFALRFDGVDDSVTTTTSFFSGQQEFTMMGWVKWDMRQSGDRIGWFGQNDAVEYGLSNPTTMHHWTSVGGAVNVAVPEVSPEWTHYAITNDATGRIVYINGEEVMTGASSSGASSSFPFHIGGSGVFDASGNWFNGCIDDVAVWDRSLKAQEILKIASCEMTPLGRPCGSGIGVEVTELRRTSEDGLRLSWKSRQDRQYDILASADLETPRAEWTEVAGAQNIPGDPSGFTTVEIPLPFEETGYLVVREERLPALFEDDFETESGWTSVVNDAEGNTVWERGAPVGSTGPLTGAEDSINAWCTNLGDYGFNSDISLISPPIDLTGVVNAELTMEVWRDGDGFGETAAIRFLRSDDGVQLGADVAIDMSIYDSSWTGLTIPLIPEALGEVISIEVNFVSDDTPDAFSGLAIDNVKVDVP